MVIAEDAATVLEEFVQDVANLPAEIAHLLEEIQAKEKQLQECRAVISDRDAGIQKHIRQNGSHIVNAKEEAYTKTIMANFEQAQTLQDEKVGLSEKAGMILDRQIRRLDYKLRDLTRQGVMPKDPPLPSMLHSGVTGDGTSSADFTTPNATNASTPLNPLSHNVLGAPTLANSNLARLAHPQPQSNRSQNLLVGAGGAGQHPQHPLLNAPHLASSAPTTPAASAAAHLHRNQRESSAGAVINDPKRRRLNAHLGSLPSASSALARQASLGPGTPKAGTPAGSARGGSAGPRGGAGGGAGGMKKAGGATASKKLGSGAQPGRKKGGRAAAAGQQGPGKQVRDSLSVISGSGDDGGESNNNNNDGTNDTAATATNAATRNNNTPTSDTEMMDAETPSSSTNPTGKPRQTQTARKKNKKKKETSNTINNNNAAGQEDNNNNNQDEQQMMIDEEEESEANDNKKYCTCRSVSYGNMVACDNDDCPYEWFHWSCVGVTKEPIGKWFCDECRGRMMASAA